MKQLFGVTTAMITPFDADGKVDDEALCKHTDFLIDKGVNCLYPCGTTGEMFKMTPEERERIAKLVVAQANGRAVVYIHTGAHKVSDVISLSRHAYEIGADGVGIVTPAFFGLNDREAIAYYTQIAWSLPTDLPIYLYNIPQCAANDLTPAAVQAIAKACPNVVGIKYSYADMLRTYEYLKTRDADFSVVQGTDRLFLPALAMGCSGTVSGVSSVYPEVFAKVYSAWQRQDIDDARKWQHLAVEICNILRCGSNLAYFKTAVEYRKLYKSYMRGPQLNLSAEENEHLLEELRRFDQRFHSALSGV